MPAPSFSCSPNLRPRPRDLVALLTVLTATALAGPARAQTSVTCETQMVPMRDGTKLYTELYKPAAPGRYPVALVRNPYGRLLGDGCGSFFSGTMVAWAQNGYVGVLQEVRGTKRSEGTFTPFFQEQNDGYDAVEWAASQTWSNGRVGLTSGSYLGVTQWQAGITAPPHLFAMTPAITASDYHDDWTGRNGVFDLSFDRNWGLLFVTDRLIRTLEAGGVPQDQINQQVASWQAQQAQNANWNKPFAIFANEHRTRS